MNWRRLGALPLIPLLVLATATSAAAQGVWVTAPTMPTARTLLGTAAATCPQGLRGTCVYAVDGGDPAFNKLEAYSPASGVWVTLKPPKVRRSHVAATTAPCPGGVAGDCVYALGGFGPGGAPALNDVEAYSTETGTWLTVKALPTKRGQAAAATAPCPDRAGLKGSCVYVFGGGAGATLPTVEAFSPATGTWATLAPLQSARAGHGGAAAPCPGEGHRRTCVYAISGNVNGNPASVEAYDPARDQWQYVADIPTPRAAFGTATAPCPEGIGDGCVHTVGGTSVATAFMGTYEAYIPVSDVWVTLPALPAPRLGLGSAAAHCPKNRHSTCVYAVGGSTGPTTGITEAFAIEHPPARPEEAPRG
ncbi:Kelch repeat-containing protein [Streptomyces sp. NPDC057011]|uniref:Kelch repeat-containing protein n=1 Tax=unclassified Streptomyces TaxID=2593676 RepID=UPI00363A56FE